jgi:hypothetical protein
MKKLLFITAWLLSFAVTKAQNLVRAEYFIDADKGFGNNIPVVFNNPQPSGTYSININLAGIPAGSHKMYFRTKDSDSNWSHTIRRNLEVINSDIYTIRGVEYFFNSDPGVGKANFAFVDTPSAGGEFNFKIPLNKILVGSHTLYLRAADSVNRNWGITQFQKDSVVTTVAPGMWSDPATWSSHQLPDSNTVIIVLHDVTADTDGSCKSAALYRNNAKLTISPGKNIAVKGRRRN